MERRIAVRGHVGLLGLLRAADVWNVQPHARHEGADRLHVARGGNRIHQVARHHLDLRHVLDVDDRRLTAHRHGFLERSDFQFGIDGGRDV